MILLLSTLKSKTDVMTRENKGLSGAQVIQTYQQISKIWNTSIITVENQLVQKKNGKTKGRWS